MVGLLTLYSNLSDQGKRIRQLLELPERASGEVTRTRHIIRQTPTKAQREGMIEAYEAGNTIRQIAERFGFHRDTVSAALERAGVSRRYHQRTDVNLDQADELLAAGLTLTETAKAMGIGRTTLITARRLARG